MSSLRHKEKTTEDNVVFLFCLVASLYSFYYTVQTMPEHLSNELQMRIFAAELRRDAPTIDFHGHVPDAIDTRLDQFLADHRTEPSVHVIHGHGKGVLKAQVLRILRDHPMVDAVVEKSGYVIVIL